MDVIAWIGTAASVGGAAVSIWQASRARDAVAEAKRLHGQLVGARKTSELAVIEDVCKRAQNVMAKYGPASAPGSLSGISREGDARAVQEFITRLTLVQISLSAEG